MVDVELERRSKPVSLTNRTRSMSKIPIPIYVRIVFVCFINQIRSFLIPVLVHVLTIIVVTQLLRFSSNLIDVVIKRIHGKNKLFIQHSNAHIISLYFSSMMIIHTCANGE